MSDLISREALKKEIMECMTAWDEHSNYGQGRLRSYEWVINLIDHAPTINTKMQYQIEVNGIPIEKLGLSSVTVEARPHGKWIKTGLLGNGNAQYECSNCHYGDEHAETQEVPYCWHCGAYMREADNE